MKLLKIAFPLLALTILPHAHAAEGDSENLEDLLKIRDPFKRPMITQKREAPKSEIETQPLESLKLIAVLSGPQKVRAMIQASSGKTYFVAENSKIGPRGGTVLKIKMDRLLVREKVINALGQEENIDTEIPLVSEYKGLPGPGEGSSTF